MSAVAKAASATTDANVSSLSATQGASNIPAAGDVVLACCAVFGTVGAGSFADSRGNTYTLEQSFLFGGWRAAFFRSQITTGMQNGDTYTWTPGSAGNCCFYVVRVSGVAASAFDVSNANPSQSTATPSTGSVTPAQADETAVAMWAFKNAPSFTAPGSPGTWTAIDGGLSSGPTDFSVGVAYNLSLGSTSSLNPTCTLGSSQQSGGAIILLKNAGGGAAQVTGVGAIGSAETRGEDPPFRVPVFVLTHHAREPLPLQGGTVFRFVTEGVESALEQARDAAGDLDVTVAGGASVIQQVLRAGLLDELQLHVAPLLLGDGVRLFDGLGPDDARLEPTSVLHAPAATHLTYRVVR